MEKILKAIECDPKCGFLVRSEDEGEVLDIARKHAKDKHNMSVTAEQLKGMLKTV